MPSFTVSWSLDVDANTAEEAAKIARQEQLDTDTEALSFVVTENASGDEIDIDLSVVLEDEYFKKVTNELETFFPNIEIEHSYLDTAYCDSVDPMDAVEQFIQAGEFDLNCCKLLKGELSNSNEIACRPHFRLTESQYNELKAKDIKFVGVGERVMTIGLANNGYVLATLKTNFANELRS